MLLLGQIFKHPNLKPDSATSSNCDTDTCCQIFKALQHSAHFRGISHLRYCQSALKTLLRPCSTLTKTLYLCVFPKWCLDTSEAILSLMTCQGPLYRELFSSSGYIKIVKNWHQPLPYLFITKPSIITRQSSQTSKRKPNFSLKIALHRLLLQ